MPINIEASVRQYGLCTRGFRTFGAYLDSRVSERDRQVKHYCFEFWEWDLAVGFCFGERKGKERKGKEKEGVEEIGWGGFRSTFHVYGELTILMNFDLIWI